MERQIKENVVFQGKIFRVRKDDVFVEKVNRQEFREVVDHHGGAGILIHHEGKFLLVKQYRYAIGEYSIEIPAGKLEPNEDPQLCAYREAQEETGYKPLSMKKIATVVATPGYCNEHLHIYYTNQIEEVNGVMGDEDEDIELMWVSEQEALQMIKDGLIKDTKTVIAILSVGKIIE